MSLAKALTAKKVSFFGPAITKKSLALLDMALPLLRRLELLISWVPAAV